ncbi:MAG: nitrilase-related carbon-nitrogen hydrolase [Anaerolineae bacterium]
MNRNAAPNLHLRQAVEFGTGAGRGNLLGIQPYMEPGDYASAESFRAKLDGYFRAADEKGWLTPKTVVVLPEHIGTWLAAAGEKPAVYRANTVHRAMQVLIWSHPVLFLRALSKARAADKLAESVFRLKAKQMARMYQLVMGGLANEYGVTVVGGSILLPSPRVAGGRLLAGAGPLQNTSFLFRPDGSPAEQVVRKAFPTEAELPFTAPASAAELPVFDTPAGRLGVLICADSWFPQCYAALKPRGVEALVVPSHLTEAWRGPWRGYNGAPPPADVDPADAARLTEGEAWLKYALAGRIAAAGATHGMNVFLRGRLWDLGADGHSLVVRRGAVLPGPKVDGALLLNCRL